MAPPWVFHISLCPFQIPPNLFFMYVRCSKAVAKKDFRLDSVAHLPPNFTQANFGGLSASRFCVSNQSVPRHVLYSLLSISALR